MNSDITVAAVSAVAAGGSLAVAVISLWVALRTAQRDRPHLTVVGTVAIPVGIAGSEATDYWVGVDVRNDGRFREVLDDLGFWVDGKKATLKLKVELLHRLPEALEPGESFSVQFPTSELHPEWLAMSLPSPSGVYATCRSGRMYKGRSNPSVAALLTKGRL